MLRIRRAALVACGACACLLLGAAPGGAQRDGGPRVPGAGQTSAAPSSSTIIVGFRHAASASARTALVDGLGHETADSLDLRRAGIRAELIEVPDGQSLAGALARYERNPLVEFAEPNGRWHASATPNDPRYSELWGLNNTGQAIRGVTGLPDADIDAQEAWDLTTGNPSVVVAVVDTGVHHGHPDLAPNIWANPGETGAGKETNGVDDDGNGYVDDHRGWDWVPAAENVPGSGDNNPLDENGHGTHVAGTIGARGNDGYGVAGVSWSSKVMPLRVLDREGSGEWWAIAKAFAYAGAKGAHVVNASLGGEVGSQAVANAIQSAPGSLFVFAAGNSASDNDDTPAYPCSYTHSNVLCVAASTSSDGLASFSNWGATSVDLAAPGSTILSTYLPLVVVDELTANATRWTFGGTNNSWGWDSGGGAGGYLSDSPDGSYVPDTSSRATFLEPVNLTGSSGCSLSYFMRLDVEPDFDFVEPEISSNGGTSWVPISDEGGWTGSTDGEWFFITEDLGAWDGVADVRVRFHFFSDSEDLDGPYDGVELDDVGVHCASAPGHSYGHVAIDGTSMATPHVAGAAALLRAGRPLATVAQIKDALLSGVDQKPAFAGMTVSGGRLNASKSLELLKTVPGTPTSVTATHVGGQVRLSWTPPASDGGSPITGYIVSPYTGATALAPIETGNVTQTLVSGLSYGIAHSYVFLVRAKNAVGEGASSEFSNGVTLVDVPSAPTSPQAVAGNGQVTVSWGAAYDYGSPITGYAITIYAGQALQGVSEQGNATEGVIRGLQNGVTYTFTIRARNWVGAGPESVRTNAVTPTGPAVAPPAAVTAGAAKVSPSKPKAGRVIVVTVTVKRGGMPVKPTRLACAGAIGTAALKGAGRRAVGSARCTFKTPRSAKGKRLKGSVSFTAGGKRFTRTFSAPLR